MKKKFLVRKQAVVLFMTMVSLLLFWQSGWNVRAEENMPVTTETQGENETYPESLIRTYDLLPDETVQVPRYIVETGIAYRLDESSIAVEETESGSVEGADVVTFTRKVTDLPDNDLARIEKKAVIEGTGCELLCAVYKVEEEDENGIPVRYSAVCEYGGLKKYGVSYPTAWQLAARYDRCEELTEPEIVEIQEEIREETEYGNTPTRRVTGKTRQAEREADLEEKPFPKPQIKRIRIKPLPEEKDEWKMRDLLLPLAAAAAGAGVTVPFIIWFSVLTAPLFGLKKEGKYRYIGRIRLKKEDGIYAAYLTERLYARAELPVFRIKLQKKVRKRTGMLRVHCPGGKKIMVTVGRAVRFTVEGD